MLCNPHGIQQKYLNPNILCKISRTNWKLGGMTEYKNNEHKRVCDNFGVLPRINVSDDMNECGQGCDWGISSNNFYAL